LKVCRKELLIYPSPNQVFVKTLLRKIRRRTLGLSPAETTYSRRGFRGATEETRARLEKVGQVFLRGYHSALEHGVSDELTSDLNGVEREWRGFAFEGTAMGLALQDRLIPWQSTRIERFLAGAGEPHSYMVHVGLGWVWARVPIGFRRAHRRLDPLLGWLAFDGWGFHDGFFHWPKYIAGQPAPRRLTGYERRAFDQGLGRSFWFVNGGNPEMIARSIGNFSAERRADLWSGIGLAATYAGTTDQDGFVELRAHAGPFGRQLGQGAAFAAKARQRAGNLTPYTGQATQALCGLCADDAANLCDATLGNLPPDNAEPAYEIWRRRIQERLQLPYSPGKSPLGPPTRSLPPVPEPDPVANHGPAFPSPHPEPCL
jgi:hypothetical protein